MTALESATLKNIERLPESVKNAVFLYTEFLASQYYKDINLETEDISKNPRFAGSMKGTFATFCTVLRAVHLVCFQELTQIVNLSPLRLHILNFFSPSCQHYCFLPAPVSQLFFLFHYKRNVHFKLPYCES